MSRKLRIDLKQAAGPGNLIVDAETGERLENVRSIKIEAGVDRATTVTFELIGVEVVGNVDCSAAADTTAIGDEFQSARKV